VAVNNDDFLINKKGRAFMPHNVRCQIVSAIKYVDFVVPYNPTRSNDMTVCEAIEIMRPDYFTKGGDRELGNIPEVEVCTQVGTKIVTGVGDDKLWSSSEYLKKWAA